MKETHTRLLKQLAEMASEGEFGDSVKAAQSEYDRLPPGIAVGCSSHTEASFQEP
jgi:hypothetical protein